MMKALIKKIFKNSGLALSDEQADQFYRYYTLINDNNKDNDLTRIKGEENFIIRHFIDSVYYTKFIKLPASLVDIGTGAGFPGIPLKIMFPCLRIILAEQRNRRIEFLKLAVSELGLKDVEFYPHKVTEKSFFHVDGVITRALEDAPETLTRVSHFLPSGGVIILLKGPDADGDIISLSDENRKNFILEEDRKYILPGTAFSRRILIFRKKESRMKRLYKILKDEKETCGIPVTSVDNKTFREARRAASGELIKKNGMITVPGKKIISDYLDKAGYENSYLILPDEYTENDANFMNIIDRFYACNRLHIFKKSLFNEIDTAGRSPILVTPSPEISEWDGTLVQGCNPVIPFQDPLNVGAAVRSCAGFGALSIILTKDAANPFHPRSVRSSSGAVFNVKFFRGPAIEELGGIVQSMDTEVVALDSSGIDISKAEFPGTFLLIPGLEGPGLPDDLKGRSVSIHVSDVVESLNASAALAIFLYAWREKLKK